MGASDIDLARRGGRERILLAVEASASAPTIVGAGARLAKRLQAEVIVLTVRERAQARGYAWDVRPAGELAEVVSRAIYELQRLGIPARGIVGKAPMGRVADEIVYAALKYQPDEIVIGWAGRSNLRNLFSSSVGARVLRLSPVPVVTIPTRKRRPAMRATKTTTRRFQPAA